MKNNSNLSNQIKESRNAQGISIRKLSELSGVSTSAISRIERNAVKKPSYSNIKKICEVLNISTEDVYISFSEDKSISIPEDHLKFIAGVVFKMGLLKPYVNTEEDVLSFLRNKSTSFEEIDLEAYELSKALLDKLSKDDINKLYLLNVSEDDH